MQNISTIKEHKEGLKKQYGKSDNLQARIQLHEKYTVASQDWYHWIFDQINLEPQSKVLELGSGTGSLWQKNIDRLPKECNITLSDQSIGMLEETKSKISHPNISFTQIDAQEIPFPDNSFDYIVANHMLYHVTDRPKAYAEINRCLKSKSKFFAATNGKDNMKEFLEPALLQILGREIDSDRKGLHSSFGKSFKLENGAQELQEYFSHVEVRVHNQELLVTDITDIIIYHRSIADIDSAMEKELYNYWQTKQINGKIRIQKSVGVLVAKN